MVAASDWRKECVFTGTTEKREATTGKKNAKRNWVLFLQDDVKIQQNKFRGLKDTMVARRGIIWVSVGKEWGRGGDHS